MRAVGTVLNLTVYDEVVTDDSCRVCTYGVARQNTWGHGWAVITSIPIPHFLIELVGFIHECLVHHVATRTVIQNVITRGHKHVFLV